MKSHSFILSLLVLALVSSCSTVTKIPTVWQSPGYSSAPMDRIMVLGIGRNEINRRLYEETMSSALAKRGVQADRSYTIFADSTKLSEQQIKRALASNDYDGILATRLLKVDSETRYVPGRTYTVPGSYYRGFYGFYDYSWNVVREPGYYVQDKIYQIETVLYAKDSMQPVWAARSETINPNSFEDGVKSFSNAMLKRLAADRIIP